MRRCTSHEGARTRAIIANHRGLNAAIEGISLDLDDGLTQAAHYMEQQIHDQLFP